MILSKGSVYRAGVAVKEFGERMAHLRVLGIPILRWCCGAVIRLGLGIKSTVMNCPIGELH